ncbi:Membrane primary amine oxidase [Cytospora mali]|uniref:Amine oxidase n=1 Tax=Cytospora mali TaxID=578113 RepID=A0A194URC1_CYTMA|nr:Membrane primary amine oxidase [Valsa mali var. pyri (nom. inval.)]
MERGNRSFALCGTLLIFFLAAGFFTTFPGTTLLAEPFIDFTPAPTGVRFSAPKANVWADLTKIEANDILSFLVKEWAELNVTSTPQNPPGNYIYSVETLQPNKSDVLSYLHEDGAQPQRWAKVVLSHNTGDFPSLIYHAVGPLPISGETQVVPLTYPFNTGRHSVPNIIWDYVGMQEFWLSLAENVSDITTKLLGAKVNRDNPYDPDALTIYPRMTRLGDGLIFGWAQFFRPGAGSSGRTLLPQGLYARVNASSPRVSEWTIGEWFYNGILYADVQALRHAIQQADFLRTPPNIDGGWTDTEDFDAHPDGSHLPPPVSVQPLGPRYRLDRAEKFVSWFGFEFYLTSTQATGVGLYDIRFKGERVMYELSLQEAMAHYAGDDPMAGGQEFLDSFFGMGTMAFELVPGYDCPAYAEYLSTDLHRAGRTETLPNNVCIFEFTSDALLSRHTAQYSVTASRNTYLTVRSVSTVGNYDYTIDYVFYLDGAIEVKVRASGYIYGAFYANNAIKHEDEYGHRIHDALSSSMHDHVISFKADIDVAGSANDMVRMAVEPTTISYPWDQPYIKERNTMHLVEYPVTEETGLDWPRNGGEFYLVYAAEARNAWGERKGYRVVSGTGMGNTPHLTITNSTVLGDSARWAEKDVWVVRQKETEPRAADPLNYLDPLNPVLDFTKIADGESLGRGRDEEEGYDGDLVLYVNVGSHHVPHSGDVPNTLMHTSSSSVMFLPHNFADRDPSRESVQGVRLQMKGRKSGGFAGMPPEDGGGEEGSELKSKEKKEKRGEDESAGGYKVHAGANYFGTPYTKGVHLPLEALEPDLSRYQTKETRITDLSVNGSAAGIWVAGP